MTPARGGVAVALAVCARPCDHRHVCTARLASAAIVLALFAPAFAAAADVTSAVGIDATVDVTVHRPAAIIPSVTQARDGYLYAASEAGLLRYDGHRFTRIGPEELPGMPRGEVLRVFGAADGALFFSLGLGFVTARADGPAYVEWVQPPASRQLHRIVGGRVLPVAVPITEPDVSFWAFAEQPGKAMWIGSNHGLLLARPDGTVVRRFTVSDGLPDDLVTALAVGAGGELWIGTGGGLARARAGRIEVVTRNPVTALAFDGEALFAAGYNDTTILGADGERHVRRGVGALLATRDGRVLAGSLDGVEQLSRQGDRTPLPLPTPHTNAIALAEDADGGVWLGTRASGLAQLRPRRLWNLGTLEGMTSDVPFALLRASDGALWATSTNAVTRIAGNGLEHHRFGADYPGWAARSLAETPDHTLWISDWDGRLVRRRGDGRFEALPLTLPSSSRQIETLFATRAGDLLLGLVPQGIARVRADALVKNASVPHLVPEPVVGSCGGRVLGAVEDDEATFWIASSEGGVTRMQADGQVRCLGVSDGVPAGPTADVARDARGTLWALAARSPTLARWTGARFEPIALAAPIRPRELFGLLDDGAGHLWITSNAGVFRVDLASAHQARVGGAPVTAQLFDVRDGMRSHEFISDFAPVGAVDGRGRIWFPTLLGLVGFATRDAPPRAPTRARLELARSGGVRLPVDAALVVGPGRADLELAFTAPTFVAPHRLTFEYRLAGVHDWRTAGPERTVVYPVLPHGTFTFELRAVDELHRPVAATSRYVVQVRPSWWQTRLFAFGVVAAAALLVFALLRLRVRTLRARYEAVHAERGRIARDLHDSLAQGFTSIGYHLDTAQTLLTRDPAALAKVLTRARAILDHCRLETRRAIWNLRAQSAGRVSVVQALARAVEEARAQGLGAVELRVDGAPPPDEPAIWEQEVPLIVQEAIANAFRHGGARRVEVSLAFGPPAEPGGFRLVVRDDGRGLPAAGLGAGGFGLFSMRDRSARFGATVTIADRADGGGAELCVVAPGTPRAPEVAA